MAVTAIFGLADQTARGRRPAAGPARSGARRASKWSDVSRSALPAAGIALIAFADSAVLSRTFAARRGEAVDGSQEMSGDRAREPRGRACSAASPSRQSSSRTPVAEQAGARRSSTGVVGAALHHRVHPARTRPDRVPAVRDPGRDRHQRGASSSSTCAASRGSCGWTRVDAALSLAAFLGVVVVRRAAGHRRRPSASRSFAFVIRSWRAVPGRARPACPACAGYHDLSRNPEGTRIPGHRHRAVRRTALLRQRRDVRRLGARPA